MKNNNKSYNQGVKDGIAIMLMFPVNILVASLFPASSRFLVCLFFFGPVFWLAFTNKGGTKSDLPFL